MSCLLDEVIKLPMVEAKLDDMPSHQQAYLKLAFDELVEHPSLCSGYASGWLDTGDYIVEVLDVSVAYARFSLALVLGKPLIILDININDNVFPANANICV